MTDPNCPICKGAGVIAVRARDGHTMEIIACKCVDSSPVLYGSYTGDTLPSPVYTEVDTTGNQ